MAGSAVNDFFKGVAGGFFGNDYLRDFKHASKTFRSGLYQNAPKFKFLFHVYFDINQNVFTSTDSALNNFGILVKSVKLPTYTFDTHTLNQYNRKRIVQTKIKYNTIDVVFHDDNDNFVTALWYRYYTYYYNDGNKPQVMFNGTRGANPPAGPNGGGGISSATAFQYSARNIYDQDISNGDDFGYNAASTDREGKRKESFFNNITIFGFSPPQHKFTAYTLINPIITSFNHDGYDYDQGGGVMTNTMTLDYETVVYNTGEYDGQRPENIITGFGDKANYDKELSPISKPGSNSNFLGKGGLIESAGGALQDFAGGNILTGIQTAGRIYNSVKNKNLAQSLKTEVTAGIKNVLNNMDNQTRAAPFKLPVYGQTPSNAGTAGAPTSGATQGNPSIGGNPTAGSQFVPPTCVFGPADIVLPDGDVEPIASPPQVSQVSVPTEEQL